MGLDAEVIAIGPFSQAVLTAMEYGPDFYSTVQEGETVLVHIFLACTSSASHELAQAFGVGTMELGNHHLNPFSADIKALESLFGKDDVAQFKLLREHGFNFFYAPNA